MRTLCLDGFGVFYSEQQGKWLHESALHNTVLDSLHWKLKRDKYEVEDLTLLARKCSKSLVSLRIHPCSLSLLGDAFRHVVRLEDFPRASMILIVKLRELNLQYRHPRPICWCSLIKSCPNLEVLYTKDQCGKGLEVIAQSCKKLPKLTHDGWVTYTGLIALAEGCTNLEYLKVSNLKDMSNEAMECVGTHLRNLRKFSRISDKIYGKTDIPLNNGIRVMLMGCSKLERLHISLY
ncbi:hypothetical protein CTI12_AA225630 [Artemisia annua]|uniref:Uncharacterized protein n=1 Tax=Artemisia annua TaxID=35608 RepID=A0A2U1NV72_ARTAN|nr:hypothetical protein CTI12_AA225630 [Artemisia annua]